MNKEIANMTQSQRERAFKLELKELLLKYSASIGANYEGDTYGIYGENMSVSFLMPLTKGDNFRHWTKNCVLNEESTVSGRDL